MRTLIIGLSGSSRRNGVVLGVTHLLARHFAGRDDIVVQNRSGEMDAVEAMAGFERAYVIDSIFTQTGRHGAVYAFRPDRHWPNVYRQGNGDPRLAIALEFGRSAGLPLPGDIRIWMIEQDPDVLLEGALGAENERVVDAVAEQIRRQLQGIN
jgi:hypothetical protein